MEIGIGMYRSYGDCRSLTECRVQLTKDKNKNKNRNKNKKYIIKIDE